MYVYYATHVDTGRVYIGKTQNFEVRKESHLLASSKKKARTHFHRALKLYGVNAFHWGILEAFFSDDAHERANQAERFWIAFFGSSVSGFNMTQGGDGVVPTEDVRQRMSQAQKRRYLRETPEEKFQRQLTHKRGAPHGVKNPASKFTIEQLLSIKSRLAQGERIQILADEHRVCYRVIQSIKHGYTYT